MESSSTQAGMKPQSITTIRSPSAQTISTKSEPPRPSSPPTFLGLPLELRRLIYIHCLITPHIIDVSKILTHSPTFPTSKQATPALTRHKPFKTIGILLVSRQTSNEAVDILYGENFFKFCGASAYGYQRFRASSLANLHRIRKLQLSTFQIGRPRSIRCYADAGEPEAVMGFESTTIHPIICSPLLSQLKVLWVVTQQPLPPPQSALHQTLIRRNEEEYADKIKRWEERFESLLNQVVTWTPSNSVVDIDDGDLKETRALVEKYLPGRYRRILTADGDYASGRGVIPSRERAHLVYLPVEMRRWV